MFIKKIAYEISDFGLKIALSHIIKKCFKIGCGYEQMRQKLIDSKSSEGLINILNHYYETALKRGRVNFDNPETFDEKIQWLKIYDSTPIKTKLADKFLVRDYVKEKIGEEYLVPLLGVWDSFDEIDFCKLPEKFVLKANHASEMNLIVKDKSCFDIESARKKFAVWLQECPQAYTMFELHYRDIPRKIIAEKYIEQMDGNLYDYKIHCFGGNAKFIQVIGDRDFSIHTAKQSFYSCDWKKLDMSEGSYPLYERDIEKPRGLDKMLRFAEKLSEGFCYVRVDFYEVSGNILFGEMTFTPAAGIHKGWCPLDTDKKWGEVLSLPEKKFILKAKI